MVTRGRSRAYVEWHLNFSQVPLWQCRNILNAQKPRTRTLLSVPIAGGEVSEEAALRARLAVFVIHHSLERHSREGLTVPLRGQRHLSTVIQALFDDNAMRVDDIIAHVDWILQSPA